jgi:hypothetical protein
MTDGRAWRTQGFVSRICLTSLAFATVETGSGCATSQFSLGLVPDADWCVCASHRRLAASRLGSRSWSEA